jgi:hypothetical protein
MKDRFTPVPRRDNAKTILPQFPLERQCKRIDLPVSLDNKRQIYPSSLERQFKDNFTPVPSGETIQRQFYPSYNTKDRSTCFPGQYKIDLRQFPGEPMQNTHLLLQNLIVP